MHKRCRITRANAAASRALIQTAYSTLCKHDLIFTFLLVFHNDSDNFVVNDFYFPEIIHETDAISKYHKRDTRDAHTN